MLDRICGYVILIFAFGINLTGFMGVAFVTFPNDSAMVAGILGFIGAVIGGAFTYIGVQMTLNHREKEKFFESYQVKMHVLSEMLDDIRFIIGTEVFVLRTIGITHGNKHERLFALLEQFEMIFSRLLKEKRGQLDWDILHKTEIRFKKFKALKSFKIQANNGMKNKDEVIEEFLDVAQEILKDLEDYKKGLLDQKNELFGRR
jgi:hypothetical protein